jgi:hypothetical protein
MNWEAIGAVGEILGAVAVFGSLLYLGLQIRQSRHSSQAETERQLLRDWNEVIYGFWENTEIAGIIIRGQTEGLASLTPEEANVFIGRLANMLQHHYSVLLMQRKNLVDDELEETMTKTIVIWLQSKGGEEFWQKTKKLFPNETEISLALEEYEVESWTEWSDSFQREDT